MQLVRGRVEEEEEAEKEETESWRKGQTWGTDMVFRRKPDVNLSIFPSLSLFLYFYLSISLSISFSLFLYTNIYFYIHYGMWKAGAWHSLSCQYIYVSYRSDLLGLQSRKSSTINPPHSSGPRFCRFACRVFCVKRFFIWFQVFFFDSFTLFQSINISIVCNYQRHLTGDIPWVSTRYAATQCNFSFCEFVKFSFVVYTVIEFASLLTVV